MDYRSYLDELSLWTEDPLACTFGDFELTRQCNFSCRMCFIRNNKMPGIEAEKYIIYAKEAANHGLLELSLTGGEVFTRSDFFEIYNPIYDLGILISIMTNGYLLSEADIVQLKARQPLNVYITLYGASDATYHRICGVSDGFSVVQKHIKQLLNAGVHITLQVTLTTENVNDYSRILQISKRYGIPLRVTYKLFDPLDISETNSLLTNKLRLALPQIPSDLLYHDKTTKKNKGILKQCKAMRNNFCVSADNHLQLCQRCTFLFEDLSSKTFIDALKSLRARINDFSAPVKCRECRFSRSCDLCLGGLRKSTKGDIIPYEYVCLYARREKDM